ncbi:hypothetical protein [Rhizobium glycinendophyticum]|uniref:Invasion associated locus B family protein n=1 Tax=Rhizobium glycinendophyticum TaxID=2589807 RepID=A0A504UY37_9HYPH|nr:hypothetical protein [Rhizobium glycinendophyticum]TPP10092.1 hypothetical protein FJQ55_04250 [Rhizobium glycinendophyticum]
MTLRTLLLSFSVATLWGLVSTWPVLAEEKLAWHGWSGDGAAQLVYGVAESDHVLLSFACEQTGSPIRFVYPYEPEQPKNGGLYDVTLKAGKQTLSLKTTGTRLEMDDLFILEADMPAGANLVALLTAGKTLSLTVGKDLTEVPLQGAATAGSALFEICGR